jgi:hypothetical protein
MDQWRTQNESSLNKRKYRHEILKPIEKAVGKFRVINKYIKNKAEK